MVKLAPLVVNGISDSSSKSVWWHALLATNVAAPRCVSAEEFFPIPDPTSAFVVAEWGQPCHNGTIDIHNQSCVILVPPGCTVNVSTGAAGSDSLGSARAHGSGARKFRLFNWAPVLPGGFALIGEQTKFVHVSPQRFVAASPASQTFASIDGIQPFELIGHNNATMQFSIVGVPGELVPTTVMLPGVDGVQPLIRVLPLLVGAVGMSKITCDSMACSYVRIGQSDGISTMCDSSPTVHSSSRLPWMIARSKGRLLFYWDDFPIWSGLLRAGASSSTI